MNTFIATGAAFLIAIGVWLVVSESGSPSDNETTDQDSHFDTVVEVERAGERFGGVYMDSEPIEIYDGIVVPNDVVNLDVSNRGLEGSLKAEIRMLSAVRTLDMSNNNFTGVPAEIGQLSELRALDLSNNPLTGLPQELGNLSKLEVLNVSGTSYSEFDMDIISSRLPAKTQIITE